jgi:hypothetical protein
MTSRPLQPSGLRRAASPAEPARPVAPGCRSERGVALVITLIMLAVITTLAVAFLATSRRERASVVVTADLTGAKLAADTALARAQAEVIGRIIATGNPWNYDLLVSTNIDGAITNPAAFTRAVITNLFFDPRPPVFVNTNPVDRPPGYEFRYFLDFNRNREYDTNGIAPERDNLGNVIVDPASNLEVTNAFVGDPEWIGMLDRPGFNHSGSNRFLYRYAYLVAPAGKSLDANFIHNHAKNTLTNQDGFLRNQGHGSWELNLAASLRDLNTNAWSAYNYVTNLGTPSGAGDRTFGDALSLLNHRYNGGFVNLRNATTELGLGAAEAINFEESAIDAYANGPLMSSALFSLSAPGDNPSLGGGAAAAHWPGSMNPNGFYDVQELFDLSLAAPVFTNFVTNLVSIGTNLSTYNRYTIYRLLAQLGVDSEESSLRGKININFDNDNPAGTNTFRHWRADRFFMLTANRLLNAEYNFGVTNIWVFSATNNTVRYRQDVHRLLQLVANIWDATTNSNSGGNPATSGVHPTVFRPQFQVVGGNVFITNYVEETGVAFLGNPWLDPHNPADRLALQGNANANVYGVPLVVGAKKFNYGTNYTGYPSFNEFTLESLIEITRKVEVRRPATNAPINQTNQLLIVGITNTFGIEAWNSYLRAFPNTLEVRVTNIATILLTNRAGAVIWPAAGNPQTVTLTQPMPYVTNFWLGNPPNVASPSPYYVVRLTNNFLPASKYFVTPPSAVVGHFMSLTNPPFPSQIGYEPELGLFPVPDWVLTVSNRLVYVVIDVAAQRVVDFVNIDQFETRVDLLDALNNPNGVLGDPGIVTQLWNTNRTSASLNTPPSGILTQIRISRAEAGASGSPPEPDQTLWRNYNSSGFQPQPVKQQVDRFRYFYGLTPYYFPNTQLAPTNRYQAGFTPTRRILVSSSWQVNDPLVHYTAQDLFDPNRSITTNTVPRVLDPYTNSNLGLLNKRYSPWGGNRLVGGQPSASGGSPLDYDPAYKDPGVRQSDDWLFPTNKFPNLGWLGRVHRGTPWQTFYLKAAAANPNTTPPGENWRDWAGSIRSHPTNDWKLIDLFTVAPNDHANRGRLSINQTNLAAWSAVLGGMLVLSNRVDFDFALKDAATAFDDWTIEPASSQLTQIVATINFTRANQVNGFVELGASGFYTNQFTGVFTNIGQFLAVPELSLGNLGSLAYVGTYPNGYWTGASPYLNLGNPAGGQNGARGNINLGLTDLAVERIPQQLLSLVKVEEEPRVAIYAFGQSLKPAPASLVLAPGPEFLLCTNYQIAGEVATRTVLRFERRVPRDPATGVALATNYQAVVESYNVLPSP